MATNPAPRRKPNSVRSVFTGRGDHLSHLQLRRCPIRFYPVRLNKNRREARLLPESFPYQSVGKAVHLSVLSCTARGFSCARLYSRAGGLLPRHFTLTRHYFELGAPVFSLLCPKMVL